MAKMFYSTEEVQQKLGISAEQVKQFVAEGKLREFSSGAKVMFKVDDVDQLAASAASGSAAGEIPLGSADSGEQIGFSPGDSADHIGLSPGESGADMGSAASGSGSVIGLAPGDSADRISLDDTSQGQDDKDDTVVTSDGVNVLDDSDGLAEAIDPLAQTQMAPDLDDHVDLDSGSSGSGLLDLSREADDTSLGAELLEEIYPGSDQEQVETQIPTQLEVPSSVSSAMSIESPESMPEFVRAVENTDGSWTFHVTVTHPDTGWDDYTNGWDIVLADGGVIKPEGSSQFTRTLLHPHVDEQPFTRSQSGIRIPLGVTKVRVRAHDIVDGFGGKEIEVDLQAANNNEYEVERR